MLLTDPPYNVNYEGKTKDKLKIKNDQMGNDNFRQFLTDAFSNADMVMKPGAVFYIWHANRMDGAAILWNTTHGMWMLLSTDGKSLQGQKLFY